MKTGKLCFIIITCKQPLKKNSRRKKLRRKLLTIMMKTIVKEKKT